MKNDKYNWDLESLLNHKSLDDLYQEWFNICTKQCKLVKDFYKSKKQFADWLKLDLESDKVTNKLVAYISNHNNEDLSDPKWIGWMQKLAHDATVFTEQLYMYTNLIIKNEDKIKSYLKDPNLVKWTRSFDLVFKKKKHILDDKSEQLMTKLSNDAGAVGDIFTTLTDSDLKFKSVKDSKGKLHEIKTISDAITLLKNKDRVLRKNTWISYNTAFNNVKNTLTKTLYFYYLRINTWSKARNYKGYIEAALEAEEADEKLLMSIYKNVEKYKDINIKFTRARQQIIKKLFKINKLEPWDLSLDLTVKPVKFSIEQAKNECLKALAPLGKEYAKGMKKAFDENWISWLPQPHKYSGAYSIDNTYGLDKNYILMNFNNTSDSVSTIAHEMGHSMNSYYINKVQDVYSGIDGLCGEIPSIVNEMLLNFYWLKKYKNNKNMLIHIYESMISTFFGCTSRQIVFSKFEWEANKFVNEGKPFTVDTVEKLYLDVRKQYEGVSKKALARMKKQPYCLANAGILRIPHFYMGNFYVYKYALGQIVAIVIADEIAKGNKTMLNNYYKFLSAGWSMSPLEICKLVGLDLHKDEVYKKAKAVITKLVNEFVKIKK